MSNICRNLRDFIGRIDTNFCKAGRSPSIGRGGLTVPFVFIARVSRGRTVRKFITVLVPSLVCVLWMSVFGGIAIARSSRRAIPQLTKLPLQLFKGAARSAADHDHIMSASRAGHRVLRHRRRSLVIDDLHEAARSTRRRCYLLVHVF
jgi:hypothetical protein